jgi:hypothetical protein
MDYERKYTTEALEALEPWLYLLPTDVQQKVKLARSVIASHGGATAAEMSRELGSEHWAICRNTPANQERYGKCVTAKAYDEAEIRAIEGRMP